MKLRSVQAIYSQFATDYDEVMRNDMQYTAHVEVPQLVINALGHRRANILDLGCGTGLSSLPFLERGWQVTGIDGTNSMLHRAQELPYLELIQQDLESPWRVRDRSFDGIVMIGVMEYIANPRALFRQAHRKLVDSGVFGVTVPYKNKGCTEANLRSYYKKEIVPVILGAGFTIESSVKTLGFNDAGTKVHYWNYLLRKS
jgi:predicted TPR repeat methyltransferase